MCVKYTNLCIVHLPLSDNNYSLFYSNYKSLIKGETFATNYTNNEHNYLIYPSLNILYCYLYSKVIGLAIFICARQSVGNNALFAKSFGIFIHKHKLIQTNAESYK